MLQGCKEWHDLVIWNVRIIRPTILETRLLATYNRYVKSKFKKWLFSGKTITGTLSSWALKWYQHLWDAVIIKKVIGFSRSKIRVRECTTNWHVSALVGEKYFVTRKWLIFVSCKWGSLILCSVFWGNVYLYIVTLQFCSWLCYINNNNNNPGN